MADQQNDRYRRLLNQESLILEATELICELMQRQGISRRELADRIGRTRGFVSQLLNGSRNMTLRTLADLAYALDHRIQPAAVPLAAGGTLHVTGSAASWFSPAEGFLQSVQPIYEHPDNLPRHQPYGGFPKQEDTSGLPFLTGPFSGGPSLAA